jgi:hypothetical protein
MTRVISSAILMTAAVAVAMSVAYAAVPSGAAPSADAHAPASDAMPPVTFDPRRKSGPQGDTWISISRLPDWKGAWGLDQESFRRGADSATKTGPSPNRAPLTPEWEAKRLANGAFNGGRGPDATGVINNSATCRPNGVPDIMQAPYAFEFLFTPGQVTIVPENNNVRRIFTDGRTHPAGDDANATFGGHSTGYWVGNTLYVDTVDILADAEIFMGMKQTGHGHVIERIFRKDAKTLQIDTTFIDPREFTRPWTYSKTYALSPHGMVEYYCAQNNRDANGYIDLTPPPLPN